MQAVTVQVQDKIADTTFLNCGFIVELDEVTTIHMGGHVVIFDQHLTDPVGAAQRFADLLTDVTE